MKPVKLLIFALAAGLVAGLMVYNLRDEGVNLTADLTGKETAIAEIEINSDRNKLCYEVRDFVGSVEGDITEGHIHSGVRRDVGPALVDIFFSGNAACRGDLKESVLRDISEEPADFYVDIHTTRYPDGAARGQLDFE